MWSTLSTIVSITKDHSKKHLHKGGAISYDDDGHSPHDDDAMHDDDDPWWWWWWWWRHPWWWWDDDDDVCMDDYYTPYYCFYYFLLLLRYDGRGWVANLCALFIIIIIIINNFPYYYYHHHQYHYRMALHPFNPTGLKVYLFLFSRIRHIKWTLFVKKRDLETGILPSCRCRAGSQTPRGQSSPA